ncbi:MAG: caspase family protein [Chitinophagaceae bacterium]
MKNYFLIFPLFFCVHFSSAQSIYEFSYNRIIENHPTAIKALYYQQEDGSGFLRCRYKDPISNKTVLTNMLLTEEIVYLKNGEIDTSLLYIHTIQPEVLVGDFSKKVDTPSFQFRVDNESGLLKPEYLIIAKDSTYIIDRTSQFSYTYKESYELTPAFFSYYFQEGDDFLNTFFAKNTKEIFPSERKIKIHLIIVANTKEATIGPSCAMDAIRFENSIKEISHYMDFQMNIRKVVDDRYNKKNLVSEFKLLKPASNDIVIFYYSGHGFRKESDKRRSPYIDLRSKDEEDYLIESMNMQDVFEIIKKKGARFNLVLSDCCNSFVEAKNATGSKPFQQKSIAPEWSSSNIRSLFLNPRKTSILATAADSTQRASSNNTFGGFFSYYFKTSLEKQCSKQTAMPNWYQLLDETKKRTIRKAQHTYCSKPYIPQNICNQVPVYNVN